MITLSERLRPEQENLKKRLDQFAADMRVSAPGIIQSFDPEKQTVSVQLSIRERVNIDGNITWEDLPMLVDVPIFMPRAGGYSLTLPIQKGDECLVVFGDQCMDGWYQSGGVQNQLDRRRHDLSDGYAIVGIWSQPNKVSSYSPNTAQLRNGDGDAYIEINGKDIRIVAENVTIIGRTRIDLNPEEEG